MRWRWRGGRARADEYGRLVERSLGALEARRAAMTKLLHLDEAEWSVDQDQELITFRRPGGQVATASVQIIGTYDPEAETWLWGWDHPSVRAPLSRHAQRVRLWGEEHDVLELTTRLLPASTDLAWQFAAVACELNEAQGVWRCDTGRAVVLVTFGTVKLAPAADAGGGPAHNDDWEDQLDALPKVDDPAALKVVTDWMAEIHHIEARYQGEHRAASDDRPDTRHTSSDQVVCDQAAPDQDAADHVVPDQTASGRTALDRAAPGRATGGRAMDDAVDRAIADKQPVYERFWRREDEYHRPCSVGTIRWYDVDAMTDWQVYRLDDATWRVTYREPLTGSLALPRAYDVRRFPDGLRIVDHLD